MQNLQQQNQQQQAMTPDKFRRFKQQQLPNGFDPSVGGPNRMQGFFPPQMRGGPASAGGSGGPNQQFTFPDANNFLQVIKHSPP